MSLAAYMSYLVFVIIAMVFAVFLVIRIKTHGRIIAFFVDRDRGLLYKVIKKQSNYFKIKDSDEEVYFIDSERTLIVNYPFLLPSPLQTPMKCLIYARNNPWPMSPEEVTMLPKSLTAREIATAMDEHVIDDIVRATEGKTKKKFSELILPVIIICLVGILAIMVFMQGRDIDGMQSRVDHIYNYIEAVR